MKKVLAGIVAALLLAAVVVAGTLTSLGSAGTPAIRSTPALTTTVRHDDRVVEQREHGRAAREHSEHAQRGHEARHSGRNDRKDD